MELKTLEHKQYCYKCFRVLEKGETAYKVKLINCYFCFDYLCLECSKFI